LTNDALVNGNLDAAEYLVRKLSTALCLRKWNDADLLATRAIYKQKQFSLGFAALNRKAAAVARMINYGVYVNDQSENHSM